MNGIQQTPKLAANGGENPQQEAVNEGDATYPPVAGMEGIRHDPLHTTARRLYSPDLYVYNPRTNPKSTVVCQNRLMHTLVCII